MGHAWLWEGMHGCQRGVCMVAGGACMVARGHVHGCGGMCMVSGGMCGCGEHAWLQGGMCGCGGTCMVVGGGMHRIQRDTVNEWAVCILLECILVVLDFD